MVTGPRPMFWALCCEPPFLGGGHFLGSLDPPIGLSMVRGARLMAASSSGPDPPQRGPIPLGDGGEDGEHTADRHTIPDQAAPEGSDERPGEAGQGRVRTGGAACPAPRRKTPRADTAATQAAAASPAAPAQRPTEGPRARPENGATSIRARRRICSLNEANDMHQRDSSRGPGPWSYTG